MCACAHVSRDWGLSSGFVEAYMGCRFGDLGLGSNIKACGVRPRFARNLLKSSYCHAW